MDLAPLLNPGTLALMIPVLVIVGGILHNVMRHRERMAMIEHGINPDQAKIDKGNQQIERR
jgi:hypothetical protein